MTDLENRFFEAFKLADKICKEELNTEEERGTLGITLYIREMERCQRDGSAAAKNWNDDCDRLRSLVRERNIIAHGNGATALTESDVEYIKGFHERLLNLTDPISLLEKARRATLAPKPKKDGSKAANDDDFFYTPPAQRAKRDNTVPPKRDNGFVYEWNPEKPKRDEKSKKWSTSEALAVSISVAALLLCAAVLALAYLGYLEL